MINERDMTGEPEADPVLRAALVDAFGEQPANVDWTAMEQRARSAATFRLRAKARVAPWWEQLTPWASRLLPVGAVAAAAALALAMATPRDVVDTRLATATAAASVNAAGSRDPIAEAVVAPNGTSLATMAGPVDDDWLWNATASAHAAEH